MTAPVTPPSDRRRPRTRGRTPLQSRKGGSPNGDRSDLTSSSVTAVDRRRSMSRSRSAAAARSESPREKLCPLPLKPLDLSLKTNDPEVDSDRPPGDHTEPERRGEEARNDRPGLPYVHAPQGSEQEALGATGHRWFWSLCARAPCASCRLSCRRTPAVPGPSPSRALCAFPRVARAAFRGGVRQRQRLVHSSGSRDSSRRRSPGPGP